MHYLKISQNITVNSIHHYFHFFKISSCLYWEFRLVPLEYLLNKLQFLSYLILSCVFKPCWGSKIRSTCNLRAVHTGLQWCRTLASLQKLWIYVYNNMCKMCMMESINKLFKFSLTKEWKNQEFNDAVLWRHLWSFSPFLAGK